MGVAPGVNLLEMHDAHIHIDRGRVQPRMAEQLLDHPAEGRKRAA